MGDRPKTLIDKISEDLLARFADVPLIDKYDVYQHLMSYWSGTMQDDVYMVVADGWKATDKGKPNTDLIPAQLIINRYCKADAEAIEKLEATREAVASEIEELAEEHSSEDGLLEEAKTDKGKLTKVSVKARLVAFKHDWNANEEREVLNDYLKLIEKESVASKKVKDVQRTLDAKVASQYSRLSEDEVKTLVVDDKWLAALATDIQTELDRVSQTLTGRIKQLAERYSKPLPELKNEVEILSMKVDGDLKKMGFAWN